MGQLEDEQNRYINRLIGKSQKKMKNLVNQVNKFSQTQKKQRVQNISSQFGNIDTQRGKYIKQTKKVGDQLNKCCNRNNMCNSMTNNSKLNDLIDQNDDKSEEQQALKKTQKKQFKRFLNYANKSNCNQNEQYACQNSQIKNSNNIQVNKAGHERAKSQANIVNQSKRAYKQNIHNRPHLKDNNYKMKRKQSSSQDSLNFLTKLQQLQRQQEIYILNVEQPINQIGHSKLLEYQFLQSIDLYLQLLQNRQQYLNSLQDEPLRRSFYDFKKTKTFGVKANQKLIKESIYQRNTQKISKRPFLQQQKRQVEQALNAKSLQISGQNTPSRPYSTNKQIKNDNKRCKIKPNSKRKSKTKLITRISSSSNQCFAQVVKQQPKDVEINFIQHKNNQSTSNLSIINTNQKMAEFGRPILFDIEQRNQYKKHLKNSAILKRLQSQENQIIDLKISNHLLRSKSQKSKVSVKIMKQKVLDMLTHINFLQNQLKNQKYQQSKLQTFLSDFQLRASNIRKSKSPINNLRRQFKQELLQRKDGSQSSLQSYTSQKFAGNISQTDIPCRKKIHEISIKQEIPKQRKTLGFNQHKSRLQNKHIFRQTQKQLSQGIQIGKSKYVKQNHCYEVGQKKRHDKYRSTCDLRDFRSFLELKEKQIEPIREFQRQKKQKKMIENLNRFYKHQIMGHIKSYDNLQTINYKAKTPRNSNAKKKKEMPRVEKQQIQKQKFQQKNGKQMKQKQGNDKVKRNKSKTKIKKQTKNEKSFNLQKTQQKGPGCKQRIKMNKKAQRQYESIEPSPIKQYDESKFENKQMIPKKLLNKRIAKYLLLKDQRYDVDKGDSEEIDMMIGQANQYSDRVSNSKDSITQKQLPEPKMYQNIKRYFESDTRNEVTSDSNRIKSIK